MTNELQIFRAVEMARAMMRQGQTPNNSAREAARAHGISDADEVCRFAVQAENDLAAWRANRPAELEETA